jgi:hypothetical protein
MAFHEEWIHETVLESLQGLVRATEGVNGAVMEFGCWEGRSLVSIAHAAGERLVHAVDHWQGNDEDEYTTNAVAERDIYATFLENTAHLNNVRIHRMDTDEFMSRWSRTRRATAPRRRSPLPRRQASDRMGNAATCTRWCPVWGRLFISLAGSYEGGR